MLRLLFPPPLCNDVLLALCKIISLPCATLFFFLPYEIAILFVLHYFFFFPCDDFFFCLVHFDYLILHNAISLYCATLYFFSLLHYSFICFCPVQPYFFSCYSFFFYPCNAQRYCFPYPTLLCIFFCAALCFLFFCPARFFFLIAIIALRNTIYFLSPYLFFFLSCTALFLRISLAS